MPRSLCTKLPVFLFLVMLFALYGCSPAATPTPAASLPDGPLTAAQAEQLAGFDVMEPTYLPAGVTFDSATFQGAPSPAVTLHFKLVHETYGDMGQFFLITQQPKEGGPANMAACGAAGDDCETVQAGDAQVQYRFTEPTESLMWESGGYTFVLTRTAGQPGKVYKDELLKVVEGMR